MAIFDALAAATALETVGFTSDQAKATAAQLQTAAEAGRGGLATKTDLEAAKADLRADLRTEIANLKVWTMSWTAVVGGLIVAAVKLIP